MKKEQSNGRLPLTFKERNRENTSQDNSSKEIMKIEKNRKLGNSVQCKPAKKTSIETR